MTTVMRMIKRGLLKELSPEASQVLLVMDTATTIEKKVTCLASILAQVKMNETLMRMALNELVCQKKVLLVGIQINVDEGEEVDLYTSFGYALNPKFVKEFFEDSELEIVL